MEDWRLDIGQHHAVKQFKHRSFDQLLPVDVRAMPILLAFGQHPGDDHLVRLLVEFRELHRVDLVVPAPDARRIEEELYQRFVEGGVHIKGGKR